MVNGLEATIRYRRADSGLYVPDNNVLAPSHGILANPMDRRGFLRAAGLTTLAGLAACAPMQRFAKDWAYDFSLRIKDGDTVYTLVDKIDNPVEEAGFKVLQAKRDQITEQLNPYINGKIVDDFVKELYTNKDANQAGEILYHALKDNDAARKAIAESLGLKVDDNIDWQTIVFSAMAAATFAFIVYSAVSGSSAAAAATTGGAGGPPGGGG